MRRAAVLEAARTRFADEGYHATSIDDIIETAGIARGTFYLYFESKRAIFDELLDELFTTLASTVKRIEVGPGAKMRHAPVACSVTLRDGEAGRSIMSGTRM